MSVPEVKLRPEKNSDESFLRKLYATTRVDVTFSGLPPEQKQQFIAGQFNAQRIHYRTRLENVEFLIIERKGRRIGRLYVSRMADEIRIVDVTITPEFRGHGIGSQLIRSIQDEARSLGQPVTLHAEKLGGMNKYYETLGFEIVEEKAAHFFMKWTAHSSVIVT